MKGQECSSVTVVTLVFLKTDYVMGLMTVVMALTRASVQVSGAQKENTCARMETVLTLLTVVMGSPSVKTSQMKLIAHADLISGGVEMGCVFQNAVDAIDTLIAQTTLMKRIANQPVVLRSGLVEMDLAFLEMHIAMAILTVVMVVMRKIAPEGAILKSGLVETVHVWP